MKGAQDNVNSGSKEQSEKWDYLFPLSDRIRRSAKWRQRRRVESASRRWFTACQGTHRVGRCELWWMSERSGDLIHVASQSRYEERKWRRRAQHDYLLCVTQGEWKWKINKIFSFSFSFNNFAFAAVFGSLTSNRRIQTKQGKGCVKGKRCRVLVNE